MLRALSLLAVSGLALTLALAPVSRAAGAQDTTMTAPQLEMPWLTIPGGDGPGKGKKIVLIAADQEYRSEEAMPQLARILAKRHGFDCTVLFAIDPENGTINPTISNIPGLNQILRADGVVLFCRFLDLPDDQMQAVATYLESGRPLVALRTSTHSFNLKSPTFKRFTWDNKDPAFEGGFGRQILGETWVAHHGEHGKQGTRGIFARGQEGHPILKGIVPGAIFGPTDVYTVRQPLPEDSTPLVYGEVTETLAPDSAPVPAKNQPMMPVAWTKTYEGAEGKRGRVFTTTMGSAQDLSYEGTRRMLVNAVYWAVGLEAKIPARAEVDLVGKYEPSPFRFKKSEEWKPGIKPSQLEK